MKYWLDTVETVSEGVGFSHFGGLHLLWLAGGAVFMLALGLCYRSRDEKQRAAMRKAMALGFNLLLGTNFMFLMEAEPGNPLYVFEQLWGDHRLGFAVLIPAILAVMYGPLELVRKFRKK